MAWMIKGHFYRIRTADTEAEKRLDSGGKKGLGIEWELVELNYLYQTMMDARNRNLGDQ